MNENWIDNEQKEISEELAEEIKQLCFDSYDKGHLNCLLSLLQGFKSVKALGHELDIDTVISTLEGMLPSETPND